MTNQVVIDCFPENVRHYQEGFAVAVIDVVRATTTAITAAASGRRCFPVATLEMALELARTHETAILAGEQAGIRPPGFDLNNSPVELLARSDIERPAILLSSSGTRLCYKASKCENAFLACLRNYSSAAQFLARFPNVAIIGAGSKGEFREEDQMCCAWIAERLLDSGFVPGSASTLDIVQQWSGKPADAWAGNKSARYLRASGQLADLYFILDHVDDISGSFTLKHGEVIANRADAKAAATLERAL